MKCTISFCILLLLNVGAVRADDGDTVLPVLQKYCVSCHGAEKQAGKVRFDKLTGNLKSYPAEADLWSTILEQIETGTMPPEKKPRPSDQERTLLTTWIKQNVVQARQVLARRMQRPENGNYLSHEKLFDPKTAEQAPKIAASPARFWRILPSTYESKAQQWLRAKKAAQRPGEGVPQAPFGLNVENELKNYSFMYTLQSSQSDGLINNARILLTWMLDGDPNEKRSLIRNLALAKEPPSAADVDKVIDELYRDWLGRLPEADELKQKREYVLNNVKKFGNRDGLLFGLVPILVHPEVVFYIETGNPSAGKGEPSFLAPAELASALHRAIQIRWDLNSFEKRARDGKLKTKADVLASLDDQARYGRLSRSATVHQFLEEYFVYPQALHVFKCAKDIKPQQQNPLFKGFDYAKTFGRDSNVTEVRNIIEEILAEDKQVLKQLLTIKTDYRARTEAMQKKDRDAIALWRKQADELEAKGGDVKVIQNLRNKAQEHEKSIESVGPDRMGVLTQRAWLVTHSANVDNHPIHRGKWIRERLLGGRIPDVPITVDAALPDDPTKTLRERMMKTRHQDCWKCHKQMDPLGLPFEQWDHFASYRTKELDRPVDTSGVISESGDPKLDGPVATPQEMLQRLADSERVHQVFVRFAFRFWMGRNETLEDARTVQNAYQAYKDSDGSMSALLRSLLTSDAFLYRTNELVAPKE